MKGYFRFLKSPGLGGLTIKCRLVLYPRHLFYLTHRWDPKYTTTSGQSGPRSGGNEGVLHIPQISWNGASPSDTVYCYTLDIHVEGAYSFVEGNWHILQPLPKGSGFAFSVECRKVIGLEQSVSKNNVLLKFNSIMTIMVE